MFPKTRRKPSRTPASTRRKAELEADRRIRIARLAVGGLLVLCIVVPLFRGSTTLSAKAGPPAQVPGWSDQLDESAVEELTPIFHQLVLRALERSTGDADLATPAFLANLKSNLGLLKRSDLDRMELLRRGYGWVQVSLPCQGEENGKGGTATLRFMFKDGRWKLDQLSVS